LDAVVKSEKGEGHVELRDVPEKSPPAGAALVRVGAAGICGSDLMILHDRFPGYKVPVVMGHEFAGEVAALGDGVRSVSVGDRVACETHAYVCGRCAYCRSGAYNLCQERLGYGYGVDGAFTKHVVVREAIMHRLPDSVGMRDAALLEPLSVVVNALTANARLSPGESVLVIGPGPIGVLSALLAKLAGCAVTVVGTERSRRRLELAASMGADAVLTVDEAAGPGFESAFDSVVIATGEPDAFEAALKHCRPRGQVVHVGESTKRASFTFSLIERKNIRVQGSFSHTWPAWERAISLLRDGKVDVSRLITHRFPLRSWEEGFARAESREGMKVLFEP
jgi:2-desacetyl-2-hydroxyethyl bacteriochlorophyllide A dehydrogenase